MKAVVVEIREPYAAALTDDGCIIKVKNREYAIGQEIEMKRRGLRKPGKIAALASAAAAVVIVSGAGAWAYCTPYSYVSLDVNPSIEYSVNRFNRVLSVGAVNGDGEEIIKKLDLKNKTIDEAIRDTVGEIGRTGYFSAEDPDEILIAASCENEQNSKKLADGLQSSAKQAVGNTSAQVEVETVSVGYGQVQEARSLGTTPGKLNLVQKLQTSVNSPESVDIQEWLKKPVKDIRKAIETAEQESKTGDGQNKGPTGTASRRGAGTSSSQSKIAAGETSSRADGRSGIHKGRFGTTKDARLKSNEKSFATKKGNSRAKAEADAKVKAAEKFAAEGNRSGRAKTGLDAGPKGNRRYDSAGRGNSGQKKTEKSGSAWDGRESFGKSGKSRR
ncbi:anti-sigma factor domain-containing protein [Clostridium sp. KNHs216]|uniref:anti-sigma factor domain-containing protein n=1 Tax=Clostridium sp. KNHs216 TaxID=1550235 RepID=UPI001151C3D5|nr:anti-sigma factor domain-containing protein [Clostridium sp. KNHs216]TQI66837.1 anti-sigma factor-like protein [Clostridium sp. KNHs216]